MITRKSVLLIQNDIKAVAEYTEKCVESGVSERNIFAVSDAESAERYLEIAGISHVIVDANLYNFMVASIVEKFSEYFPIQTIITDAKPEQKTLRMLSDKSLTYVNAPEELPMAILGQYPKVANYGS